MKKLQLFLTACLLLAATTASAQFANTGSGSKSKGGSILTKDTESYNRVYVGYTPISIDVKTSQGSGDSKFDGMDGVAFGYTHGFSLSKNLPLFLEAGLNFQASFGGNNEPAGFIDDEEGFIFDDNARLDYSLYSFNIPVNLAYKFSFLDNKLGVTPFVGFNFRIHLSGKQELTCDDKSKSVNLFDDAEDAMGKVAWNRFQMGFNVGANINYKAFSFGVYYTADFMPIQKYEQGDGMGEWKLKTGVTTISLGYNF